MRGWVKAPPSKHPVVDVNTRLYGDSYGAAGDSLPGGTKVSDNEQLVAIYYTGSFLRPGRYRGTDVQV